MNGNNFLKYLTQLRFLDKYKIWSFLFASVLLRSSIFSVFQHKILGIPSLLLYWPENPLDRCTSVFGIYRQPPPTHVRQLHLTHKILLIVIIFIAHYDQIDRAGVIDSDVKSSCSRQMEHNEQTTG